MANIPWFLAEWSKCWYVCTVLYNFVHATNLSKLYKINRVQLLYPTAGELFCVWTLHNCSQKFSRYCFRSDRTLHYCSQKFSRYCCKSDRCFTKFSCNFILIKMFIFYLMSLIYVYSCLSVFLSCLCVFVTLYNILNCF